MFWSMPVLSGKLLRYQDFSSCLGDGSIRITNFFRLALKVELVEPEPIRSLPAGEPPCKHGDVQFEVNISMFVNLL